MTDLKPCPFCGGEATVRDGKCEGGFILEHHNRTTDPDCLITVIAWFSIEAEAIAAWNSWLALL